MKAGETPGVSRRDFIRLAALAGGGFSLGFLLDGCAHLRGAQALGGAFHPNAWLRITPDDKVTFILDRAEMGQGVVTSHVQMLAEELEVDPQRVTVAFAPADRDAFGIQLTGGSTSVTSQWDVLRQAGATGRELLKKAAARQWKVDVSTVTASQGAVNHPRMGRLSYGQLASAAAEESISDVKLKEPHQWKVIGTSARRLDGPAKTDGSAVFGIDVRVPGMLHAVVLRPPVVRGKLVSFDAKAALGSPGVKAVVEIPHGVAVVADSTWRARKAAGLVEVRWDHGDLQTFSTDRLRETHLSRLDKLGHKVTSEGDVPDGWAMAARHVTGTYEVPYLNHATMEPMNCTADVRADRAEIWVGTQSPTIALEVVARITGFSHKNITINTTFLGGGFGRRATGDFIAEAVEVSQRVKAPVQVLWSREDDMRHGQYRPSAVVRLSGGVDAHGMPVAWHHRMVTQSLISSFSDFLGALAPEWIPRPLLQLGEHTVGRFLLDGHIADPAVSEGSEPVYELPNFKVELAQHETGVPVFVWRSVGHSINGFVVESFLDELAHLGGRDPLELRRALLKKAPRNLAVLNLAAEKIGWGTAPPPGHFRGIAQHKSFDSYCAHAVEVSVDKGLRIHRVVTAVDCGRVVNPDLVAAQMESGVLFGISAALRQRIDFDNGKVRQSNFHDFPLLRMHEAPVMETHIVSSTEKPTGAGEIAVPPMAPALANALFAATGVRFRRLPMEEDLNRVLKGQKPAEVKG